MRSLGSKSSLKMAWGSCGNKKRGTCMAYGVRIECWGDYACFTRPEMNARTVSQRVHAQSQNFQEVPVLLPEGTLLT